MEFLAFAKVQFLGYNGNVKKVVRCLPGENNMKTAIIYVSVHHKNTEKLVKAISAAYPDVTLLDAKSLILKDLQSYDLIGVASGIFYGKMHKSVLKFLDNNLPERKKTFIMYTSGSHKETYGSDAEKIIRLKNSTVVGKYSCRGFDTFGPFKLIGGIQKEHPDQSDIDGAVNFLRPYMQ